MLFFILDEHYRGRRDNILDVEWNVITEYFNSYKLSIVEAVETLKLYYILKYSEGVKERSLILSGQ